MKKQSIQFLTLAILIGLSAEVFAEGAVVRQLPPPKPTKIAPSANKPTQPTPLQSGKLVFGTKKSGVAESIQPPTPENVATGDAPGFSLNPSTQKAPGIQLTPHILNIAKTNLKPTVINARTSTSAQKPSDQNPTNGFDLNDSAPSLETAPVQSSIPAPTPVVPGNPPMGFAAQNRNAPPIPPKAATKIQANFRGYKARLKIASSKLGSPSSDVNQGGFDLLGNLNDESENSGTPAAPRSAPAQTINQQTVNGTAQYKNGTATTMANIKNNKTTSATITKDDGSTIDVNSGSIKITTKSGSNVSYDVNTGQLSVNGKIQSADPLQVFSRSITNKLTGQQKISAPEMEMSQDGKTIIIKRSQGTSNTRRTEINTETGEISNINNNEVTSKINVNKNGVSVSKASSEDQQPINEEISFDGKKISRQEVGPNKYKEILDNDSTINQNDRLKTSEIQTQNGETINFNLLNGNLIIKTTNIGQKSSEQVLNIKNYTARLKTATAEQRDAIFDEVTTKLVGKDIIQTHEYKQFKQDMLSEFTTIENTKPEVQYKWFKVSTWKTFKLQEFFKSKEKLITKNTEKTILKKQAETIATARNPMSDKSSEQSQTTNNLINTIGKNTKAAYQDGKGFVAQAQGKQIQINPITGEFSTSNTAAPLARDASTRQVQSVERGKIVIRTLDKNNKVVSLTVENLDTPGDIDYFAPDSNGHLPDHTNPNIQPTSSMKVNAKGSEIVVNKPEPGWIYGTTGRTIRSTYTISDGKISMARQKINKDGNIEGKNIKNGNIIAPKAQSKKNTQAQVIKNSTIVDATVLEQPAQGTVVAVAPPVSSTDTPASKSIYQRLFNKKAAPIETANNQSWLNPSSKNSY